MGPALSDPSVLAEMGELWPVTPGSWHQRNLTILEQAFTTTEVRDQYNHRPRVGSTNISNYQPDPMPEERLQDVKDVLARRTRALRDIMGRLDLYEELPAVRTSGDGQADELVEPAGQCSWCTATTAPPKSMSPAPCAS